MQGPAVALNIIGNHKGQVFSTQSGLAVYPSLYVWDGSSVPSSLGVNPLWTISALAERAVALMIKERGWAEARQNRPQFLAPRDFSGILATLHGECPLLTEC